jgi:hypothetical protein
MRRDVIRVDGSDAITAIAAIATESNDPRRHREFEKEPRLRAKVPDAITFNRGRQGKGKAKGVAFQADVFNFAQTRNSQRG